jgi:acetyl-CoA acetyltransferase
MSFGNVGAMSGAAIAGLGLTELGKVYGRSPRRLAADAVRAAADDAGLALGDLDGLLVSHGLGGSPGIELAETLGLRDLRLLTQLNAFGATAGAMISYAAMSVLSGAASTVACVFADAPLQPERSAGAAYNRSAREYYGFGGMTAALGFRSVNAFYALAAQRHMARYGTTSEQLGAIAVATRQWAAGNPLAQMRTPITLRDHQESRWVAEPLHLLDCCLVSNGAIAVIVTGADWARDLRRPPVHLWGWGQGHPGHRRERGSDWGLTTGAATSGPIAMKMAGITPADVDVCQLYDCYTYTVLVSLEDYGFCAKGEGGAFAASGALGPGGALPTNTGGGQLSAYYMWGMTPVSEAVIQARGDGGERQAAAHDVILVSGNGGILDHHSTLIVSPHEKGA